MESYRVSLFLILLGIAVSLVLSSPAATATATETKLVREVCQNTSLMKYKDCVEALNDFRTGNITDIRALAFLSLDLARANSSEAVGFVRGLSVYAPSELGSVLKSCYDNLLYSHMNFHVAVGDLMVDPMTANYDTFVAMDGVNYCRNVMKEAKVSIPEVEKRCDNVEVFVHLCYTTTGMVGETSPEAN
ncbi:hypothetical protein SAY86_020973 [Trapa natans]|uniref:Pectinesterase inhibitor domain-containing protein n=1 Tax=Trapa natans TaxID=22666 RepID=A0AAN7M9T4_TRANT|nr:hypothetical protein SAY86_020973 [Trapa natans]